MKLPELPVTGPGQARGQETGLGDNAGEPRDERDDVAATAPEPLDAPPSEQDSGEPGEAPARGHGSRGQATKMMLASAVTSFFACLYLEFANGMFLGAACTALALVVYWVAEHNRNRSRRP